MTLFNFNCFMNFNFAQPNFSFGCFTMPNFFSNKPFFNNFSYFSPTPWFQQYSNPNVLNSTSVFNYIDSTPSLSTNYSSVFDVSQVDYSKLWNNYAMATPSFDTFSWYQSNKTEKREDVNKEFVYDNKKDIYATKNASKIKKLDKEMQERTKKLIAYANENGYDVEITSGYRTQAEQIALQKKYKNEKGRVAKNSAHCQGKAIDIKVTKNGQKSDAGYKLLGKYATSQLGMRWGGNFTSYRERWHFDYNWA